MVVVGVSCQMMLVVVMMLFGMKLIVIVLHVDVGLIIRCKDTILSSPVQSLMLVIIPNRSLGRLFNQFLVFMSVYAISAFLLASCPRRCLAVAERYSLDAFLNFASDVANLLETNANLPETLMTDLGLFMLTFYFILSFRGNHVGITRESSRNRCKK